MTRVRTFSFIPLLVFLYLSGFAPAEEPVWELSDPGLSQPFPPQTDQSVSPLPPSAVPPSDERKPVELSVTTTRYLPAAMYGQWSVTARLMETNAPELFSSLVHDIWILERNGEEVTISNPSNGASATINVDEVRGNTATFHRKVQTRKGRIFYEKPTVTVDGDVFYGITRHRYEIFRDGRLRRSFHAQYELTASRIGGTRVRFRDDLPPPSEAVPDFDIEEVQQGPAVSPTPREKSLMYTY